ncbi:hypothetical protein H5394_16660 [Paracoccus sp. MC1862]|nr:hypothetical protein [Paracoccus sp. MC1854]MBB1499711.1 hypothetical protein [Paracoccus sp. MC1862]QQO45326.1 hypothetical protein JGR78_02890 [Paracoccus sp. MC1862]
MQEAGVPVRLVLMLHGCTQGPDHFSYRTDMNRDAEGHGLIPGLSPSGVGPITPRMLEL